MQRALRACWRANTATWRVPFTAELGQQHVFPFSTAPKQTVLNKTRKNIRKSGKHLGEKAEQLLEKVVNLEENAPPVRPPPSPSPPPQKKQKPSAEKKKIHLPY